MDTPVLSADAPGDEAPHLDDEAQDDLAAAGEAPSLRPRSGSSACTATPW
jgi:hypothetical protein